MTTNAQPINLTRATNIANIIVETYRETFDAEQEARATLELSIGKAYQNFWLLFTDQLPNLAIGADASKVKGNKLLGDIRDGIEKILSAPERNMKNPKAEADKLRSNMNSLAKLWILKGSSKAHELLWNVTVHMVLTESVSASTLAKFMAEINRSIASIDAGELPDFLSAWKGNAQAIAKLKKELEAKRKKDLIKKAKEEAEAKAKEEAEAKAKEEAEAKAKEEAEAKAKEESKAPEAPEAQEAQEAQEVKPEAQEVKPEAQEVKPEASKSKTVVFTAKDDQVKGNSQAKVTDDEVIELYRRLHDILNNEVIPSLDHTIMARSQKESMRSFVTAIGRICTNTIELHIKHKENKKDAA